MKIRVTLKDPDGFYDSIDVAIRAELKRPDGITEIDRDELLDGLARWIEYGRIAIEFDTDAKTATVVERAR